MKWSNARYHHPHHRRNWLATLVPIAFLLIALAIAAFVAGLK